MGITYTSALTDTISRNSIYSNAMLGIDLAPQGVTPNDSCDTDTGPNELQNYPVLTSASSNGSSTTVVGSLDSTASSTFTIEFFYNDACDPSGYGQGQHYIGSATVTTNGSCTTSFSATLPVAVPSGEFVTADATDALGNTSEFSRCVQSTGGSSPTPTTHPNSTPTAGTPGPGTATPTPSACNLQYTDVPVGSTFYPYIHCLACLGIINGYPDGTFKPNNPVTRGQLSKIVSNSAGFSDNQTTQMFQDVPIGSTFFQFVGRLVSRGYISGYPCGGVGEPCVPPGNLPYFRTNNNATRGQISKIVSNAASFSDLAHGTAVRGCACRQHILHLYLQVGVAPGHERLSMWRTSCESVRASQQPAILRP